MNAPPDYYRILHVQPDAPAAIIHTSYRTLLERARAAGQSDADIAMLDEAYAVLGNRDSRMAYDVERASATGTFQQRRAEGLKARTRRRAAVSSAARATHSSASSSATTNAARVSARCFPRSATGSSTRVSA